MPMTIDGDGSITGLVAGGLPNATIVQADLAAGVAGNGPAFSAYATVAQSISSGTFTKVNLGGEEFDTNNNFASSTFTPTVAGYYQVNAGLYTSATSGTMDNNLLAIYKNGVSYRRLAQISSSTFDGVNTLLTGSELIYMNGTTDYLEIYGYVVGTSPAFSYQSSAVTSYFSASLVRAS